jgi:cobalt/nickel transport system permease protein
VEERGLQTLGGSSLPYANRLAFEQVNPVEIDEIMHIPDGYLSPSTCATFYVVAASGWYVALKRIKQLMATRAIPLISVFAAFCFVVMMFNVPLPGGTTGHAVGVGVSAIVLGPWGSILAISIALAIQALFFGDGGITTLGANCFNMAMVGSFTAYSVYRLIAANSDLKSRQRVLAAAIAGYVAINASALFTAVELGIQPTLFHDASGTPLYAPYPLHVAIPAMMIGHLTLAGLAEAVIAAGMVSYLQRADLGLLSGVMNGVRGVNGLAATPAPAPIPMTAGAEPSPRRLWWIVACLMLFTPLGILAAGTAWGEWSSSAFMNPHTRDEIAAASGNHAPPASVPVGIQRLSTMWTAPFPGYAPGFIRNPMFGYLLSAIFGVGCLVLAALVARALGRKWSTGNLRS